LKEDKKILDHHPECQHRIFVPQIVVVELRIQRFPLD
jgi:hypothetical protein